MKPYFIGCDREPTINNAGTRLQCTINNGAEAFTEQQVSDFYAPALTPELAFLYSGVIFTVSLLSWGFRLSLKQYNLGV